MSVAAASLERALRGRFGAEVVADGVPAFYLTDATEARGLSGSADAVALPRDADEVAEVVAWCYEHGVPMTPRGGGTGFAGGAVPQGGVVVGLERVRRIRSLEPLLWRMEVEAGVTTADVRRVARENGLLFPPDPGAAEQSQIGGNVATNAGGPHAFKYGVTGDWVTGVEVVVAPGELISVGGPIRKDVAGYDLRSLIVGSEGTLGIVTAVWLRLAPAPEAVAAVVSLHAGTAAGCEALARILGSGIPVAALEYLDGETLRRSSAAFPVPLEAGGFLVLTEVDGSAEEVARLRAAVLEVLAEDAISIWAPEAAPEIAALWRWRDGVSLAVQAERGGKVSEDIVVPFDRLAEAIEETLAIGARHRLAACSWGHAGDGNLHSTFLIDPNDEDERARAESAADELFELAARLGGSISGEHGLGLVKSGRLAHQWAPGALALHAAMKSAFDPKGLFNPGKEAMTRRRVHVSGSVPAVVTEALAQDFELVPEPGGADGILSLITTRVDDAYLEGAGPQLAIVANYGVGLDNIDLDAARSREVQIANTPDVLTRATAELTIALTLSLLRRVAEGDRLLRSQKTWTFSLEFMLGEGLEDRVFVIVGPGRIGRETARLAEAFGARPVFAGRDDDLHALLATADVVSIHCPLTPDTHHLIDAAALATMRPTAVLVNTARGPIVDEAALVEALASGRIAGAALDVYEDEPRVSEDLLHMENVVLTPHIGSGTRRTREAMGLLAVSALREVLLHDRRPANAVV